MTYTRRRWVMPLVVAAVLSAATVPAFEGSAAASLTIAPDADAVIRASQPTTPLGSGTRLKVDNSPVQQSLLRFVVAGVAPGSVQRAVLRLHNVNGSPSGGDFHAVGNSWVESTVAWNTAPAPLDPTPVASLGRVAPNTWYEVDLTAAVRGDGTYSFRASSRSGDGADYVSREGSASLRPALVLTLGTPDTSPPSRPSGLTATAGPARVDLAWGASADDVGVAAYRVLRDGINVGATPSTSYADLAVVAGGSYTYTVVATDAAGNASDPSDPASATVPEGFAFAAAGDHGANPVADASLRALDASGVAFYLALGDLDYDQTASDAGWCDYVRARLPTLGEAFPFELVAGNHEQQGGPDGYVVNHAACLPDRLGATLSPTGQYGAEYYVDHPPADPLVRVVMIAADLTVENVEYDYVSGGDRAAWLAGAIDGARAAGIPWVVVGMHKVCLTTGVKSCEIGSYLLDLLVARRVDLVLQAHDHNYQRSKQLAHGIECQSVPTGTFAPGCVVDDGADGAYPKGAGTVIVIAGTFGRSIISVNAADAEAPYFATISSAANGFVRYTVTRDRLDAAFVASTGTLADQFAIAP